MRFDPLAFFSGFISYLRYDRAQTLAYASVIASPESWVQFEALDWLHRNRDAVGLGGGDSRNPGCDVFAELKKNDLWLQDGQSVPERNGIAIEFKVIYNNKNFWSQIQRLRWDLSPQKLAADGFAPEKVVRYGVAVLIYVRYGTPGSSYQLLRNESRGKPTSPDEFRDRFLSECCSINPSYSARPPIFPITQIERVVSLDDQPYIDPNAPGCAVWSVMLKVN